MVGQYIADFIIEKLTLIWQEVLEIDQVGVSDDFFTLGGDSILALTVVTRARAAGLEISVRDVVANPILSDLAARVAESAHARG